MNKYICTSCGRYSYSAATPDTAHNDNCGYDDCDGRVVLAVGNEKEGAQ